MKWDIITLGHIATFSNGINFNKSSYGKGVRLICVSNFKNHFFPNYQELDEIKKTELSQADYLQKNDIVFVRSNGNKELVGRCMLIDDVDYPVTFSGFCIRCRLNNIEEYSPVFFTYYFKSLIFRKSIANAAVGTNIQNLNQQILKNHLLNCPPYPVQQKIAGILSAYDDLIENNQKQIKLLEEAAQRLYKEWFVDFRFPGHETAKFINGLPEGWRKGTLSELGQFKRGKTITKEQTVSGSVPVVAGGLEPAYYHNQSNTESPVVTVSASGANAGFTRMYFKKIWASDCSFIDCKLTENLFFMYVFLKENPILLKNLQKGSAQPHVYPTHLNNLLLIIPAKDLLKKFCYVVTPIFSKLGTLDRQISILQEARDRLLPKLMNGEIEV